VQAGRRSGETGQLTLVEQSRDKAALTVRARNERGINVQADITCGPMKTGG
jgi:hypothetical protein